MKKIYFLFSLMAMIGLTGLSYGQKVLTLQPGPQDGIDTYINSIYPDQPGYNISEILVTAWTLGGTPYTGMDLFKFDLSQINPHAVILDAKLSLYYDPNGSTPTHTGANASFIKRVTSGWDVMTVCWTTQPPTTDSGKIDLPETTDPYQDFPDIDVKNFVTGWVADSSSNFGMLIGLYTQDPYACLVLYSSDGPESSKRPKLVITYLDCDLPVAGFITTTTGRSVSFTDTSSSAQSWNWDFGDGYYSTLKNPNHQYDSEGNYYVCLTVLDSCGSGTHCDTIHACNNLVTKFGNQRHGHFINFSDSSQNAVSWYWDFGDGFMSVLQNPVHYFADFATYEVCLTATDNCGSKTWCDSVTVSTNGIPEKDDGWITFYPNPVNDNLILHRDIFSKRKVDISVSNILGETVYFEKLLFEPGQTEIRIDCSSLKPGLYFISLVSVNFHEFSKFIKL